MFTGSSEIPPNLGGKNDFLGGGNCDFEPKGFELCPPAGSLLEGEGNGNATFPISVPGVILRNYVKPYPVQERRSERDQRDEFQGNEDHVAHVTLDSESLIEF